MRSKRNSSRLLGVVKTSIFFLLLNVCIFALPVDFDVIVVGSSPIPLIEALYHHHNGKRVLVLEGSTVCGGAWKSIEICGHFPVDLGCHTLGNDKQMLHFLEDYVGCNMVSMDNPHLPFDARHSANGFYFAHGCYEIIHNLIELIAKTDIVFLLDHPLESVFIQENEPIAIVKTKDRQFTTSKILVTPYSHIELDNPHTAPAKKEKMKFYHLYMLIEDMTPPRFSFRTGVGKGISRLMNLTPFVGINGTGTQLMVFQTYGDFYLQPADIYLDILKKNDLIDASARVLKAENYIYEQEHFQLPGNLKNADLVFEVLKTNHIQDMSNYIAKWKQVLQPFTPK